MYRWMAAVALALGVIGGLPDSTLAQQATSEVRGQVVDSQGGVLPGVTVTVTNQET